MAKKKARIQEDDVVPEDEDVGSDDGQKATASAKAAAKGPKSKRGQDVVERRSRVASAQPLEGTRPRGSVDGN